MQPVEKWALFVAKATESVSWVADATASLTATTWVMKVSAATVRYIHTNFSHTYTNHGRRSREDKGDKSPQNLERGDANANSPQILSYRYKYERSVAFKMLGELTTLPQTLSRLERGHPSPYPTPLGTDPPSALAMRPPRSPARSTPMIQTATNGLIVNGLKRVLRDRDFSEILC